MGIIKIPSLSKFDVNTILLSVIIFLFLTSHLFIALLKTSQFLMWKVQVALEGGRSAAYFKSNYKVLS